MATIGEIYRRNMPETVEISCQSLSRSGSEELHVLAVDDSHVDRKVIERLLKISSCRVTVVESGTRALQYLGLDGETKSSVGFDGLKVNMIMTDYSMPGMTGYELLKKIKESSAFREIPVVIMSSENIMTRIDRCLEEGAEEFIVKPVKLADVKRLTDFIMKGDGEKIGGVEGNHKRKLQDMYGHLSSSPSPSPSPSQSSSPSSSLSELQSPPPSPTPSSSLSPSQSSSPLSSLSELHSPSPPPSSSLSQSQSPSPSPSPSSSSSLSELQSPLPPPSSSSSPSPSPSLSSSSCACDLSPPPSSHSPSKWHRLRNWH